MSQEPHSSPVGESREPARERAQTSAVEHKGPYKQPRRIGERMREHVDDLIAAYSARLRADPLIPMAAGLPRPQLEDHAMSFLGDILQTLVVLEEADILGDSVEGDLLKDGSKIQRLISELHGHQRYRLDWTDRSLEREYEILIEEAISLVGRHSEDTDSIGDVDWATDVLKRLLERAREASFRGYRDAAAEAEEYRDEAVTP
jgi:hypothetical protein